MAYTLNDSVLATVTGDFAGDDHFGLDGTTNGPRKVVCSRFVLNDKSYADPAWITSLAASKVGLGSVENKSSATIRGEITSGNVTTALGFTPYNSSNPSGYITSSALSSYLPLSGGTLTGASTVSVSSWVKWTLETIGVTARARQGSDGNGLNFTSNALWTGSAWAEDDTTKKKFAYIQHLGNGRHEFRTSPTGAGISWTTSLTVDENSVNSTVALTQGGNQVLHAGNIRTINGNSVLGSGDITISASSVTNAAVITALGFTPYNSTNPNGYISSITSANVTTALGYTPYNATNPNGYISSITSANVTTALGYTPYNSSNPSGYITSSGSISGNAATATTSNRSTIEDTRASQRTPNAYDDYRASYEFTNQITGTSDWHTAFTMQGWHDSYSAWQIIGPASTSAHENFYLRSGVNTSWNTLRTILHSGNYTSYSPSLTGSGASGTWNINVTGSSASCSGNASTAYGLNVHGGRNNEANKVVRTDANGYIQAGWINTDSGDNGTTAISRVYASNDGYVRYYTPANFRTVLDVPTRTGGSASGTWGISISGNSATTSQRTFGNVKTDGPAWGSYSAASVEGSTNGWGGISFGSTRGNLMVNPNDWGFYGEGSYGWTWRVEAGVLTTGTIPGARVSGNIGGNASNITAYTINQSVGSGDGPTFAQVYTNGWFRNTGDQGLYNSTHGHHFYATSNQYFNLAGNDGSVCGLVLRTGGHQGSVRGYLYANSGNNVGFLSQDGNWQIRCNNSEVELYDTSYANDFRTYITYDRNDTAYYCDPNSTTRLNTLDVVGVITVGVGQNSSNIYMADNDEGQRRIHCNSNRIGFLNDGNGWGSYCGDGGEWYSDQSVRSPIFYDNNDTSYFVDGNSSSTLRTITNRGWLYINEDYGHSVVGVYASTRLQGVFAMGDSYKLPASGIGGGSLYGIAWSHPNAGGVAGNLNTHGALLLENGGYLCALSGSIRCRDDMRTPIYYDSNDTAYYIDPNSDSNWQGLTQRGKAQTGLTGRSNWRRPVQTGDQHYWGGQMGWGQENLDTVFEWGTGFWDTWGSPANQPSGTSHWTGINCQHHISYGWQMGNGAGEPTLTFIRGKWGGGWSGWLKLALYDTNTNTNRPFYAQQFIDAENTGYYCDPNNTSRMNAVVADNLYAYGTVTAYYSDDRLKTRFSNIVGALDKVCSLNGFFYEANEVAEKLGYKKKREVGLSAQEVQRILPEIISPAPIDETYMTIQYDRVVPLLVEAIKELRLELNQLKSSLVKI